MNQMRFRPALGLLVLASAFLTLSNGVAASQAEGQTLVLYDAASGALPEATLMSFTDFPPGAALPAYAESVTVLDTTVAGADTYAGWVAGGSSTPGFPILDRTAGFQVNFTLQLERESHSNNHRAGFNVIILSQDAKGIEVAFWTNQIWVQSDDVTGGLFRHGEGVAYATTRAMTQYQVSIAGDAYTLTANGEPILKGPLRDYTTFDGFPDPYETPNFIFLGDDTTSAQAQVRLSFLSVTGTGVEAPTAIPTISNTSSPLPEATSSPMPSEPPIPSSTPQPSVPTLCPSGWIWLSVLFPAAWMRKRVRAG